jgi:hypothetical protein
MSSKVRALEVDATTADAIEARAAARGISVDELLLGLVEFEDTAPIASAEEIAELDRIWAAIEAGQPTIPHAEVDRWLATWGTPKFKPWPER